MLAMADARSPRLRDRWHPMRLPEDEVSVEQHLRLLNWAQVYRDTSGLRTSHVARTPDELDAALVEEALVVMMRDRPLLWKIVWCRYVRRWLDTTSAWQLRMTSEGYRTQMRQMYVWLKRHAAGVNENNSHPTNGSILG